MTPCRAAISLRVAVALLGRRVDAGPGVLAGLAGVEVLGVRPAKPLGLLRRVHGTPGGRELEDQLPRHPRKLDALADADGLEAARLELVVDALLDPGS